MPFIDPNYGTAYCYTCKRRTTHKSSARRHEPKLEALLAGEVAKEEGIAQANANPSTAPWRVVAMDRAMALAATRTEFTSEDITATVGVPAASGAVGALLSTLARRGVVRRVGFRKAERVNQHAALVSVWVGR